MIRKPAIIFLLIIAAAVAARGGEVIPPSPAHYFNDYTNTVSASDAQRLDDKLSNFDKQTSNQVVVVMYPTMQSDSSIEDYANRTFQSWRVGTKEHKNGVVLFVFKDDHKMRIEVGYGLEGALPDITCGQIIANELRPRFRNNDFAGGFNAAIDAIIAATQGEYKAPEPGSDPLRFLPLVFFAFVFLILFLGVNRARLYRAGRRPIGGYWFMPGLDPGFYSDRSSGGSWGGGGGWSSGGGGGFSGGGGSSGGGGASGSW